jgi:hypothetical protein
MKWLSSLLLLCAACGTPTPRSAHLFEPASVSPDAVRKVCAMEQSCLAKPPFSSGGDCVSQIELGLASGLGIFFGPSVSDLERYVGCMATANDCASALDCATAHHGASYCQSGASSCDGDTRVSCIAGLGLSLQDCAAQGQKCVAAGDDAICSTGKSCNPDKGLRCDGTVVVDCNPDSATETRFDCANLDQDAVCARIDDGTSQGHLGCVKKGSAACTVADQRCDGTKAVTCNYGAVERTVDCASFGNQCAVGEGHSVTCVPTATECSPSSPDSCDGDSLRICVNGHWAPTACSSIGLRTCGTVDGKSRCVP